jgi:hypothetical protein
MVLYEQTFNPPDPHPGQSGAILPWSVNMIGGFLGTYNFDFAAPDVLRDADTGQPINGNTGVFTGIGDAVGGPGITNNLRLFYTVDGQAGFSTVDPATCPDNLYFNIYANTQAGGADDRGYFAIQAGGPAPRDPVAWYVSSTPMATPTVDQGSTMNLRSLLYNPAAGNWNNLMIDPTNTVAPVVGGPAGSLAGLVIKGVGVLQSVTNPAPLPDFSNPTAFSSWNYADYKLTCGAIPEPTTFLLLATTLLGVLSVRRR